MNAIDLFWIILFIGGLSYAGYRLFGLAGLVAGGSAGLVAYLLLGRLANRDWRQPPCHCGTSNPTDFEVYEDATWSSTHRCKLCSRTYVMRKGSTWDQVFPTGERKPYLRRTFRGAWDPALPPGSDT